MTLANRGNCFRKQAVCQIDQVFRIDVLAIATEIPNIGKENGNSAPLGSLGSIKIPHLIDQRVRVTDVTAESALTRDTVPVNVDAIVFWTVWDAQKSVLEVADYLAAVALSAQTALREAIGRHQLAEMITERERLGRELRKILDDKTNAWGITIHSVEIRDVKIPAALEDAMSSQAQAERERQARIILGTAETEIAERFVAAGEEYSNKPIALHLRAMNMLYEAIKEKGSMVIVPSSAVETMGLGGMLATTALAGPPVKG